MYVKSRSVALAVLVAALCAGVVGATAGTSSAAAVHVFVPAGIPAGTPNDPLPDARAAAITHSGIRVSAGDVVTISATGTAGGGPGFGSFDANGAPAGSQQFSGPVDGRDFPHVLGPPANIYSLVGAIDDSSGALLSGVGDEWFLVGTSLTMTADRAGELVFVLDDALYRGSWTPAYLDNTGGFDLDITVGSSGDATPPVLHTPSSPLVVEAGAPGGFDVTATDDVDGTDPVSCTPADPAVLPVGYSTVSCSATDSSGNTGYASFTVLAYGATAGGSFAIGDLGAAAGAEVTFWGAQWSKANPLSGGPAPRAFKGFATGVPAACGAWTAHAGNGTAPATVPDYIAVVVTSSLSKTGSVFSGDGVHVAVVRTDPGYDGDLAVAGTGTVVASVC